MERAAEIRILDGPQHDADLKAAKAVREILKGFEGSNECVALIGSVCVLKYKGRVVATTLSQEQLAEVRKNPAFLSSPMLMEGLLKGETEFAISMQGNGKLVRKFELLEKMKREPEAPKKLASHKSRRKRGGDEPRFPRR